MKKTTTAILIALLSFISFFAQSQNDFFGALTIPKNQLITYKLSFEITDSNTVKGLSTTDFMGANKTVSKIEGTLTADSMLSFHETSNLSTISVSDNASFCYVYVKDVKLKNINDNLMIQGSFVGKYPDGTKCAEGKINLVSTEMLKQFKTMLDTASNKTDSTEKITSFLDEVITPTKELKTLHKNEEIEIKWTDGPIVFDIWDGYLEDNDVINIYQDGELVEAAYTIKNKKRTFTLPFVSDTSVIKIVAINEGGTVSNTVNYNFKNETTQTPIISNLKKGEAVFIKIIKK